MKYFIIFISFIPFTKCFPQFDLVVAIDTNSYSYSDVSIDRITIDQDNAYIFKIQDTIGSSFDNLKSIIYDYSKEFVRTDIESNRLSLTEFKAKCYSIMLFNFPDQRMRELVRKKKPISTFKVLCADSVVRFYYIYVLEDFNQKK